MATYPFYKKNHKYVLCVLDATNAIAALKGGSIVKIEGLFEVNAAHRAALTTSKQKFEMQLNANLELINDFKTLCT